MKHKLYNAFDVWVMRLQLTADFLIEHGSKDMLD